MTRERAEKLLKKAKESGNEKEVEKFREYVDAFKPKKEKKK